MVQYSIYQKHATGAWHLIDNQLTYDQAIAKYADMIKYSKIQDILLTENLPYTVTYDSQTQAYTASYPEQVSGDAETTAP